VKFEDAFIVSFTFFLKGMMCDYLQTDMRMPEAVRSIDDINISGYEVFVDGSLGRKEFEKRSVPKINP
jgi:hypothetical protein